MLVESPKASMTRMYFRSPQRVNKDTTYVFPRGPHNGVVLGGCRFDNDWSADVNLDFAEDIKRRCCALAPELGAPEDLRVIHHGVGLRRKFSAIRRNTQTNANLFDTASRRGGARVEREKVGTKVVIHNYGAGGAGYQSSWYVGFVRSIELC
jgi:D-amino-acid oxidase